VAHFELELEFIHAAYADAAQHELGLEIAAVSGGGDVGVHSLAQGLDVGHCGVEGDVEVEAFE